MDITMAKVMALVLFLLIPVALGSLSLYLYTRYRLILQDSRQGKGFLSYLNCFAGGFFLGTCLLLVLGQGIARFEEYRHLVNLQYKFPFFEVGIGVGFFLVALIEKLTHLAFNASRCDNTDEEKIRILEMTQTSLSNRLVESDDDLYEAPQRIDSASSIKYQSIPFQKHTESDKGPQGSSSSSTSPRHELVQSHGNPDERRRQTRKSPLAKNKPDADKNNSGAAKNDSDVDKNTETGKTRREKGEGQDEAAFGTVDTAVACGSGGGSFSLLRVMLLVLALSFHTVFDGLTVGLQEDVNQVLTLLVAISVHKAIMALVLGMELASVFFDDDHAHSPARPFLALLLFSLASPLGVAIGIAVTSGQVHRSAQLLAATVLQAVATGVFLYVTCFEVLARDMAAGQDRAVLKVLTAMLGFTVITVLETITA